VVEHSTENSRFLSHPFAFLASFVLHLKCQNIGLCVLERSEMNQEVANSVKSNNRDGMKSSTIGN
jgi:hypothetical protein